MNTILNKLRISTGFAVLSAEECAELVAHIEGGVVVPREFLKAAQCPQCDGDGAYYDNTGQVCQCEWCDVRAAMLKEAA